jgi:hypothetical protein
VQFLLQGVTYGPRTRRLLALFAVPAAVAAAAVAAVTHGRTAWLRALLSAGAGLGVYLSVATSAVLQWRNRKIVALVGDVGLLRQRVAQRRRDVDRLFWQEADAPGPGEPDPDPGADQDLSAMSDAECVAVMRRWVEQEPRQARARAAQLDEWRADLRRCGRMDLLARARLLQAAAADAPDASARLALEAKLAALAAVYRERRTAEPARSPSPTPGTRVRDVRIELARAQADLAHLQNELARMVQQRATLLRRRLPLD